MRAAPHTLQRRKYAPALKKRRLSTQTGVLYYYCYLYIKLLKNNQNPNSGVPITRLRRAVLLVGACLHGHHHQAVVTTAQPALRITQVLLGTHRRSLTARNGFAAWYEGCAVPRPCALHRPSSGQVLTASLAPPKPLQYRKRSVTSSLVLSIREQKRYTAVAIRVVLIEIPAAHAHGA